ncbi:MAG: type III secretion protein [Chthoniobacterales bacterium]|nr:type III secretion protein [Chthoniobacterales bacterium]
MRSYPLAALQILRQRREEEANQKLAAARAFEETKKKEVEDAQKALDNYLLWIKKEADRLFSSVIGTLNPIHKITDVTQQVSWNRTQQSTYVVALEEAKKTLEEAQRATQLCINAQQTAYKEAWKIEQHHQFWIKQEKLREEQEEEADLEEIANTIFLMKHG